MGKNADTCLWTHKHGILTDITVLFVIQCHEYNCQLNGADRDSW